MEQIDCDATKLSQLQKAILLDLVKGEDARKQEHVRRGEWNAADRAAFSRSVRRLESRGLITRKASRSRKIERLNLTSAGREVAEDLQAFNERLERIKRGEAIDLLTGEPLEDPHKALRARTLQSSSKMLRAYSRIMSDLVFQKTGLRFSFDLGRLRQVVGSWSK